MDSKKLYPVSVIEEEDDRVKIHYEGYSDEYDEWRSKSDIKSIKKLEVYQPFELHKER